MSKYPIYIVSKGRAINPLTANLFIKYGIDFKICIEPQEYQEYLKTIEDKYILVLPFSNLGVGSYPARDYAMKHAFENGYKRYWCFDDNIRAFIYFNKGQRIYLNGKKAIDILEEFTDRYTNIAISGFNYDTFVRQDTKKAFYFNCHVYSAMLIRTDIGINWRLKYNEDVDICLQALTQGWCTVNSNSVSVKKVSTVSKMKGGNQTDLYKGNSFEKKVLKARSLEAVWPEHVKTIIRFNRPHHLINWKKHFKTNLIKDQSYKINDISIIIKKNGVEI